MSLWKYTFELATKELDLLKKKKQALDDLFASKKISQSVYEHLDREIGEALKDIVEYIESIISKMRNRAQNLEKQIETLELFLASLEILHVAGEIEDEAYERQSNALTLGLESTRQELDEVKRALEKIAPKPSESVESEEKAAEIPVEEKPTETTETI